MSATHSPTGDAPPAQPEYADPVERPEHEPRENPAPDEPDAPSAVQEPILDPEGEIEELEDRSMPIERTLWAVNREGKRVENTYVQSGLMWFGKIELYGLLGQAVKVVLEGDNPLGIGSLVDIAQDPRKMLSDLMGNLPGADTAPDQADQQTDDLDVEAGKVLAAFAQVVAMAPEIIPQAYCIALAIPKTHRNWAIEWAFPNMDDEMGKDVLNAFIDQNWGVMEDFFTQEVPKIVKRIVRARQRLSGGRR